MTNGEPCSPRSRGDCRVRVSGSHRRVRRRVAQERADQGARMFERSEFARTPPGPSNAACPQRKRRVDESGSLFFAYFLWRDKESEAPAGARPGNATKPWGGTQPQKTKTRIMKKKNNTNTS